MQEAERKRRVRLFLEASRMITDYANQARNATSGEPQQVLIVFDTILSRKGARYFQAGETERKNITDEFSERKAEYFLGNDTDGEISVARAYKQALELLNKQDTALYDPSGGDDNIRTFAEAFAAELEI